MGVLSSSLDLTAVWVHQVISVHSAQTTNSHWTSDSFHCSVAMKGPSVHLPCSRFICFKMTTKPTAYYRPYVFGDRPEHFASVWANKTELVVCFGLIDFSRVGYLQCLGDVGKRSLFYLLIDSVSLAGVGDPRLRFIYIWPNEVECHVF